MFKVTDETIRRDLRALEQEGILMRSYGGAFIQSGVENLIDSTIRTSVYVESKTFIAEKCKRLINNGDVIFLDNSTTAFYIAKEIKDMRLTLVTNSLTITNYLAHQGNIRLIVAGGFLSAKEQAFYGIGAEKAIKEYYVDKAFLSCRSLSIENGCTDSNELWTQVRKTIIERSKERYLVADFSKFNQTSFMHICGFDKINAIVTDKPLGPEWHSALQSFDCGIFDEGRPDSFHDNE
ncbi:DeoR/GlpR family DNA-binding transcription regulator [Pullulanibacillus sp. KACC 23026]|uniref:DeoR/GlpR family DNA-binding transcription regulator n=1 Tax=Pullulanibacillus sp. KACC 23026 TaxID=3028315 RepID=UPI0023B04159|nr:DeoR/GlpR family DNA-binding transcription regulator [Pullulanibacillus sp. KACC 23026]WEG13398.1 DeoR/GlpR family DNA-binding transcription regulator [Pullulanibacillus sp. KACC 23026]